MDIQSLLASHHIVPDTQHDQFFLTDVDMLSRMVDLAELQTIDTVLEIGAGVGNLTQLLAKKAGKVIAFEIDLRLAPILNRLPSNVEMHTEDAWEYVQLHGKFVKRKAYNKIVSNLPYSFAEKFLHNLTFLLYDKAILLVPESFAKKISDNPIFSSFFCVDIKFAVPKEKFYPIPNTNSVVIDLKKLPDPVIEKNLPLYLRQYIYQHEEYKLKNSLREGLISYAKSAEERTLTKKQAKEILARSHIDSFLLEKTAHASDIYRQIEEYLTTTQSYNNQEG